MAARKRKIVLFLCTGNYYRSRFAEILFNSVAERMQLPWQASSRALALERGSNNVGAIAKPTLDALKALRIRVGDDAVRFPLQATPDDFAQADYVVALKDSEHRPLMLERFPTFEANVEYWQVDDAVGALGLIEAEVMSLSARLITGAKRETLVVESVQVPSTPVAAKPKAGPAPTVRVSRETKGRRGKGVTIVSDVPLDDAGLLELAGKLKERCGTGGTVKDGQIEIQGDQRDRLTAVLEAMGFRVKRSGG